MTENCKIISLSNSVELSCLLANSSLHLEYSCLPNRMYDCTVPICMWMMIDAYFSCCHCSRAPNCSFERLRCQLGVFDAHTPSDMSLGARLLDESLVLQAGRRSSSSSSSSAGISWIWHCTVLTVLHLVFCISLSLTVIFFVAALNKQIVPCSPLFAQHFPHLLFNPPH